MITKNAQQEEIFVTRTFLPPVEDLNGYIGEIYKTKQLTNQGPLVKKLELKLKQYLNVENFHFVTNGTIALQLALRALDIEEGEVITTPFTYVATTSAILWEKLKPVYVDIEPDNFTIDPNKIEEKITSKTRAIMPVHIYGYACDVDAIQKIADKYNLKVIYDAAHAFGSKYKGKSLVSFGDISTLSFHATKLFHTVEGGAVISKEKTTSDKLELIKRFGHNFDNHICPGINAKQTEFNAAMGLSNLPYVPEIIEKRKKICLLYDELLNKFISRPKAQSGLEYNYAYYPVLFKDETALLKAMEQMHKNNIYPRRYFYPSLNKLPYLKNQTSCPISENICSRVLCLPLYAEISEETVIKISDLIKEVL